MNGVSLHQRFTRERPCPICGGFDKMPRGKGERCGGFLSADGEYAHCTREEKAGGLPMESGSTYAHRLKGSCKCGVVHDSAPVIRRGDRTRTAPAFGPADVAVAWRVGLDYLARVNADGGFLNGHADDAFTYLTIRKLAGALDVTAGEPLAVILPPRGAGLRGDFLRRAGQGYRIMARLYDVRTGEPVSAQVRFAGAPPDGGEKIVAPFGARLSGTAYMNPAALDVVRGTTKAARVIVAEGLADFVAFSLALPGDPVISLPGAGVVDKVLGPMNGDGSPAWFHDLEVIDALDPDDAGEKGSAAVLKHARAAARVKVRRVTWPDGCHDAGDVIRLKNGAAVIAEAVREARSTGLDLTRAALSLGDLLDYQRPRPEPVIGPHVSPGQYFIIAGRKGSSKTMLAIGAALAAVTDGEWCGISCHTARVGIVSMEVDSWELRDRITAQADAASIDLGTIRDRVYTLADPELGELMDRDGAGDVDILTDEWLDAITGWAKAREITLVILDTMTDVHTAEEKDLRPVILATKRIARGINGVVGYVHHIRKPPTATGRGKRDAPPADLYETRGDSRFINKARLVAMVTPHGDDLLHVAFTVNAGRTPKPAWLKRSADNGSLTTTDAPEKANEARSHRRDDNMDRVMEAARLLGGRWFTASDLAHLTGPPNKGPGGELGVTDRSLRDYLKGLVKSAHLQDRSITGKPTRYRVPDTTDPRKVVPFDASSATSSATADNTLI